MRVHIVDLVVSEPDERNVQPQLAVERQRQGMQQQQVVEEEAGAGRRGGDASLQPVQVSSSKVVAGCLSRQD
jgi:hypothetical protein